MILILNIVNVKPEDANTKNCKVARVIFNNGDFSIAYLYIVDENINILGCRWNYNYGSKNILGSPNIGKNPKWLYYSEDLFIPTLNSISGLNGTNEQNRIDVIQAIEDKKILKP